MTSNWRSIQDYLKIMGFEWDPHSAMEYEFKRFLKEKLSAPESKIDELLSSPNIRNSLNKMIDCMLAVNSEEGLKGCITVFSEKIARNTGKWRAPEITIAKEFYEYLSNEANLSLNETWAKFLL